MANTGLYKPDGSEIISNIYNADDTTFEEFMAQMKDDHPLQYLNLMSTNLDVMIREYNDIAIQHGESIIAAVFVDDEEPEYEMYKKIIMGVNIDAKDEDTTVHERSSDGESTEQAARENKGSEG